MNTDIIVKLNETIKNYKENPSDSSYTCKLFQGGENKIIKKLGEENAEFIKAFLTEPNDKIASEAADYLYHLIVALHYKDIDFADVLSVLTSRHQEKTSK